MHPIWLTLCLLSACGCTPSDGPLPAPRQQAAEPANGRPPDLADQQTRTLTAARTSAPYIDDATCAECHAELWESYQELGMARSVYEFDAADAIESFADGDAQFYHAPSDMHFSMFVRNGRMVVGRYRQRADGTRINEREQEVDLVIGSGNHVRSYLYRNTAGELFEMPIVWYTQEQSWGMAPGYDLEEHEDFDRPITRQCLGCHNAYPAFAAGEDAFGAAPLFPAYLPHGIGCQRCHGPGGRHAELAATNGEDTNAIRESIVNPKNLPADRGLAVCLQCHLQPISRRTSIVRNPGMGDYAFQPGDALDQHLAYVELDEQTEHANRFEINHHAYRLFQSQCYLRSEGKLNCLTCHDPHAKVAASQSAAHYRSRCLSCHAPNDCLDAQNGDAANADCVSCHMLVRRTQDVVHLLMTDHKIVRRGALADPKADIPESELASDLPIRPYAWSSPSRNSTAQKLSLTIARLRDRDPTLLTALKWPLPASTQLTPAALLELGIELGQAQLVTGHAAAAVDTLRGLTSDGYRASCIHTDLGTAFATLGQYDEAVQELKAALEREPDRPEAHYNVGLALARQDRAVEAMDHYRRAIALRPTYAKAHFNLGNLWAKAGRLDEAAGAFQRVLGLKPNFAAAYKNLSAVLRRQRHWTRALQVLQDGRHAVPGDGPILNDLFLLYTGVDDAKLRDWPRALDVARQYCEISPMNRTARLTLALAQAMSDQAEDASNSVTAALQAGASPPLGALIAAIAQRRLGQHEAAERNYQAGWAGTARPSSDRLQRAIRMAAREIFE